MNASVVLLFALSLFQATGQHSPIVSSARELEVKSAFLFNFLKYVEWPASRAADTNAPLIVGIPGNDPITSHLRKIAQGRTVNGRSLEIRSLAGRENVDGIHVLWVGAIRGKQEEDWLCSVAGKNVLTIGETEAFTQKGGIITFVMEGDKIRFDVNMKAARRQGVMVRAQLQKLARKLNRADE
jgi:hypothetical protein